jgi:UDPglucose 6-dehydrogenase
VTLRLTVIGTGYLGATHAACMAELGFEVLGMDVDEAKVATLRTGKVPFYEPGLDEVLARNIDAGRLRFTTSYEEAAAFGDVHFVCVGTPQQASTYAADLSHIDAVVDGLAPHLSRPCLVVGKSTVPVGTADTVAARVRELAPVGEEAEVAWNPEFLREGHAVDDTLQPDRLVIGVRSVAAEKTLREVYSSVLANGVPLVVTDFATAEIVKVAANAFLATKISFINAMAEVCEATGADVSQLSEALGHDPRIGGQFLRAGLGFGGGCLPKDIRAFMARAGELGVEQALTFLREVDDINLRRRDRLVDLATEVLDGSLMGKRIAVLGAAFKPESDDVRDSPALHVAASLQLRGAQVAVYDPAANANAARIFPSLDYVDSADAALSNADAVLVLTEWAEFRTLDPEVVGRQVRSKRMLDGRLCLDGERWRAAGWTYRAPGRP